MFRYYAINKGMIDIPVERSSHSIPTPRGGGMAIVISYSFGLLLLTYTTSISAKLSLGLFCAGLLVALIGWLDDKGHVNARWRLLVHFTSAVIVVYATEGLPVLFIFGWAVNPGFFGTLITIFCLVWILNLYNFMDGIDGLAASQGIVATTSLALLILFVFNDEGYAKLHWMFAACCFGFFLWNYPPAKIFMGDACSGFIGIIFGGLLLASSQIDQSLFWAWLVMLGVFIVDATFTLLQRIIKGHVIYDAHKSHAYQNASRKLGSHRVVTISTILINIIWLAPLAYSICAKFLPGSIGLVIAYFPLILLCLYFKAGVEEKSNKV